MSGLVPPVSPPSQSSSSIALVGLEELVESMSTLQLRLPLRRRALRRVVIAAVSACALILVAAGVTRVVHASSEPDRVVRAVVAAPVPSIASRAAGATPAAAPEATGTSEAASAGGAAAAAATSGGLTAQSAPMAGTLHLERNVTPRWVLLDGKKLSSRNEVVACGSHQIKVGHNKARSIDIPCGGELTVSR
jgi:hypothetical protein